MPGRAVMAVPAGILATLATLASPGPMVLLGITWGTVQPTRKPVGAPVGVRRPVR